MTITHLFSTPKLCRFNALHAVWRAGLLLAALALAAPVHSAVLSWTGAGANGNWNDTQNWGFAGTPAAGDTLIFPSSAVKLPSTNNIVSLVLSEVRFVGASGGFNIFGNVFSVTNIIQSTNTTGTNVISTDLTFPSGSVTITVGSTVTLNLAGAIGGNGAVVKSGAGTLAYVGSSPNTYTNVTTVNQGTLQLSKTPIDSALHGPLIIGDGSGGINSDVVHLGGNEQMVDQIPVTINSSGLLDLAGTGEFFGSLAGTGNLVLGTAIPRIGVNNASTIFDGTISGTTGGVVKRGSGTLTLNGNNTYSDTQIDQGKVIFNGYQPTNMVTLASGATVGGNGTVGAVVSSPGGGIIAPGSSPGMLTSSNVFLGSNSVFSVELNGRVPGTEFDQLNVVGTNNITGTKLALVLGPGFAPLEGEPLVILVNDGTEAITGTFQGLAEGSVTNVGGLKLRISYVGGTGNDITLTLTNAPAKATVAQINGGNGNLFLDVNECADFRIVITNTSGASMTGIKAKLASATPGVNVTQPNSAYPDMAAGATATNLAPFQISTQPVFPCGGIVTLTLSLSTASNSFSVPFTFAAGSVFPPARFDYSTPTNLLDFATNDIPLVVSGISNAIAKVTVSMAISHTFDRDLTIYLIGPNGTTVELTSDNGGSGHDYGTDCGSEATRTTFDDAAATSITAGSAPYTNTFRPESPLYVFGGLSGSDVNGSWTLRVVDTALQDSGTLKCWSLFLSQYSCPPGGGACPNCPNATISGVIGEGNALEIDRLSRLGIASACGAPTDCPGAVNHGSTWYEPFTFQNGPSNACITVSLSAPTTDLYSAAYLGFFDATNICLNYLADAGNSTSSQEAPVIYSMAVPSNAVFVVIVNSIDGTAGPYQLTVTGGDCRPVLKINRTAPTQVKLDWPSYASGYLLESIPSLSQTNWATVPSAPALGAGGYSVTDSLNTNRFYRLRKPL